MEFRKLKLLIVLCICTIVIAEDVKSKDAEKVRIDDESHIGPPGPVDPTSTHSTEMPTTTKSTSPTTTKSTAPTTTTPTSPTTTTKSTSPTTTKPTTTTKSTTTTKPTITTKPTTPTTTTPTTTTPITTKPTTTAPPSPGKPQVGNWSTNCITAKMAIQLDIDYMENNVSKKAVLNVPATALAKAMCDKDKQQFSLSWNTSMEDVNNINFDFMKNNSEVSLANLSVSINGLHRNGTGPMDFFHNKTEFEAPLKHSYKCNKEQDLKLISPKTTPNCTATFKVSELQIQAFKEGNTTNYNFGDAIDCVPSTPDIVPIAVGCALAALVVIVLLAYLYGRRRSQARGYLSM